MKTLLLSSYWRVLLLVLTVALGGCIKTEDGASASGRGSGDPKTRAEDIKSATSKASTTARSKDSILDGRIRLKTLPADFRGEMFEMTGILEIDASLHMLPENYKLDFMVGDKSYRIETYTETDIVGLQEGKNGGKQYHLNPEDRYRVTGEVTGDTIHASRLEYLGVLKSAGMSANSDVVHDT